MASSIRNSPIFTFRPKKLTFYTIFFLLYCVSGLFMVLEFFPYRPALVTLLVVPLIVLYGLKIDRVFLAYAALTIVLVLSAIINKSSAMNLFLFARILVFSYLMYYLVECYVNKHNLPSIMKLSMLIGVIQLPIVALQYSLYDVMPITFKTYVNGVITYEDIGFGTFRVGDAALNLFLLTQLLILLFEHKRSYFIRYRLMVILCFTATVLIGNSNMAKFILFMIWVVYLLGQLNRKRAIYLLILLSILLIGLLASGLLQEIITQLVDKVENMMEDYDAGRVYLYLEGRYARGAALYYFFHQKLSWFGDGPSRYVDPVTMKFTRGNFGHIFTFYSEVGLLGWLLSVVIFFLIAFRPKQSRLTITKFTVLLLIAIQMMSFTENIMNDAAVFLTYCIASKIYLIAPQESVSIQKRGLRVS